MLNKELLQQVRHIQLRASYLVTDNLSGEYHSAFRGQGIEFDELREYVPGDDVRSIDWKVTARMNAPFVKVFREEREQTLMLMVDVSASQEYTSHFRLKREIAAELAAILAFLAIRNNDKIGLIIFSDHVEHYIPPKKGRGHVWNIIRIVLSFEAKGTGTDLNCALDFMASVVKKKSMCFIISDFISDDFKHSLARVARKHETVAVRIQDPAEHEAVDVGLIEIEDSETRDRVFVDLSAKKTKKLYKEIDSEFAAQVERQFGKLGVDYFSIGTNDNTIDPLTKFIKRKDRKKR